MESQPDKLPMVDAVLAFIHGVEATCPDSEDTQP